MSRESFSKNILLAGAVGVMSTLALADFSGAQAQSADTAYVAAMDMRFQQLEREIRRLTGQVEEQEYEIRKLRDELSRVTGDLELRVNDIEGGRPAHSGANGSIPYSAQPPGSVIGTIPDDMPQNVSDRPKSNSSFQYIPPNSSGETLGTLNKSPTGAITSTDSAAQSYDHAYSFIKSRDYQRAEDEFARFIETYPDNSLVPNAKYWYAETFYVRGDYEKSARVFAEGYQKFPDGPKAASNLLKLGMSLIGLDKKEDACIALKQLKKDYAGASIPVLKRADSEMKKINCR